MLFSTPVFLFLFLPVVLAVYFLAARRYRNTILLIASLVFYAWGEQEIVLVMLLSIVANYLFGWWVKAGAGGRSAKAAIAASVVFNLGLLVVFKYTNWLWRNVVDLLGYVGIEPEVLPQIEPIRLPIGISFFTFQAMSYVIDCYRKEGEVQRNPINFALYIALFPQLIAGPIVRYRDVARQLVHRTVTREGFAEGVRRFTLGLGKKMLVANVVALPADRIFAIEHQHLTPGVAWLGILCYTVQIYFDFSGYSDMAIGLGRMFGFKFLENFNYPYISRSITEFWRRWHISLSSWFRDYLYIPLGGNRKGQGRTYFNLITVFLLCGLWHGAAWNFLFWGLFHGLFLVIERSGLSRVLESTPRVLRHAYVLIVVMVGWVFFRAPDIGLGGSYALTLFGLGEGVGQVHPVGLYLTNDVRFALLVGAVGSMPWLPVVRGWVRGKSEAGELPALCGALRVVGTLLVLVVLLLSAMELSADTYNPFIYFRF